MILLVEDDENDVFLMERAMEKASLAMPMHVAKNGQEALDYLQATGKYRDRAAYPVPTIIVMDIKIPFIRGLEVLHWMRQQPPLCGLPVAMLTSSLEESDRQKASELGVKTFLIKPPTPEMLLQMVESLLKPPAGVRQGIQD
jgi:CheY-like chemotaxis protein